jgi:saccharopine dehydrogenase-like NADP-dependent oxidoreductase
MNEDIKQVFHSPVSHVFTLILNLKLPMKEILIFGAGKSATYLIEYLCKVCEEESYNLCVCDTNLPLALSKIRFCPNARAVSVDVANAEERIKLIRSSSLVISMLPPHLHFLVAQDCLLASCHLLTASYIDNNLLSLRSDIEKKGLLFLCETGLDPGIDHMSAMKIIDHIHMKGGKITSFKSHCGGLVAPESDNNPWHYKITWNPGNIVRAGSLGAAYLLNGQQIEIPYQKVFETCEQVKVPGLPLLAWYPNRDSLTYMKTYQLADINTFLRTTLRYPSFCKAWNLIVNIGLTDNNDGEALINCNTYRDWFDQKCNHNSSLCVALNEDTGMQTLIDFLEIRSSNTISEDRKSSLSILQGVMEKKLAMTPGDKDMIVMLHELEYVLNNSTHLIKSALIVKGEDQGHTAMAKTVGLPLGIAAKLILTGKIKTRGLQIPVTRDIYEPILSELEKFDIAFSEINLVN